MAWELNPATNDIISAAIKQGHRITACESCGGPQVWSLAKPKSRCFRCNRYQEGSQLKQNHRLRCDECHRYFMTKGLKKRYCDKCSRKLKLARSQATDALKGQLALEKGSEDDEI